MNLARAEWQERAGMQHLLDVLGTKASETRYVGGCVRDTLLDVEVNDVDVATRLPPQEVIRRLEAAGIKAVPTGLAHGTITAVSSGTQVEVTTLRRDVSTDGRRATVAFTTDWREDAGRRDFTINALSADPVRLEVHDYFDGLSDLKARRVRFIGDALTRIAEDHLRILRFFRFHARFGCGDPDPAGLDACTARANDLMALSRERIAGELLRLLGLADPVPTLRLMVERGIWKPVLPEITGVEALARAIAREQLIREPAEPIRRLAALLPPNPDTAAAVGARLKLSNEARQRLAAFADPLPRMVSARHLAFEVGTSSAISLLILANDPDEQLVQAAAELKDWQVPRFPLKGSDLIDLGLPRGAIVARTLGTLREQWCAAGFPGEVETRAMAQFAVDQALRSLQ